MAGAFMHDVIERSTRSFYDVSEEIASTWSLVDARSVPTCQQMRVILDVRVVGTCLPRSSFLLDFESRATLLRRAKEVNRDVTL